MVRKPDVKRTKLTHVSLVPMREIYSEESIIVGAHLEDSKIEKISLDRCVVENSHFVGANITETHIVDCVIEKCDFTAAALYEAHFERVFIKGTRLQGAIMAEAELTDVQFGGLLLHLLRAPAANARRFVPSVAMVNQHVLQPEPQVPAGRGHLDLGGDCGAINREVNEV